MVDGLSFFLFSFFLLLLLTYLQSHFKSQGGWPGVVANAINTSTREAESDRSL